jgi:hypothetical protein
MNLADDDLLLVARALYWYNDKIKNQQHDEEGLIELENLQYIRHVISEKIKQRGYLL